MEASEQLSKRSLLFYVPLWVLWGCFLLLPFWSQWAEIDVLIQVGTVVGRALLSALVLAVAPVAIGIDKFGTWVRRAIFLPVAFGLGGLFLLVPFFVVIVWTLRAFAQ